MKNRIISLLVTVVVFSLLTISCGDEQHESEPQVPQQTQPGKVDTVKMDKTTETAIDVKKPEKTPERIEEYDIPETYEVREGETLASIAYKFYQDSTMWFEIFAMNELDIDNWNKIYPGQELKMPQGEMEPME